MSRARRQHSVSHPTAARSFLPGTIQPAARRDSLAERAYVEIRNQILRGDLPVGLSLSRRKLADTLKISVPPVMEALQQLEREGLVESKPRVGTRVRIPTRADIEDRSLLREALETQAARLFAERATPAEKTELVKTGCAVDREYGKCESGTDADALFAANLRHMNLHLRIAQCSRCQALHEAIEKEQVLVLNWLHDTAVRRRTLGSNYHERLTLVLARGTPAQAAEAMRKHIRHGLAEVLARLSSTGQNPAGWRKHSDAGISPG